MDPNTTLAALRRACEEYWEYGPTDHAVRQLVEGFDALDGWLSRGGFQPDAWGGSRIAGERFYA